MTVIYGAAGENGRQLAWPLLRRAVRLHWGWADLPAVERSPRGKPGFTGLEDRWFSLSHSGGLALCALSDAPVGVDVERVVARRAGLPQWALNAGELAGFDGSWGDFYRLWTLKESWCKQVDAPLYPPRAVDTPPPCPHRSYAGPNWRAAVCCRGAPPAGEIVWLNVAELTEKKEDSI